MTLFQTIRLCSKRSHRWYTNRNILQLRERGVIQEIFPNTATKQIADRLNASPQCVYAGFDPTADSLHVGNLLVLVNLLHWQRGGHNVIALIGGATGQIGDPSGRTTDRVQLGTHFVNDNLKGIKNNIEQIFENHSKYLWGAKDTLRPVTILNNEEWYGKMNPIDFVSKIGRNFRMGTMLLKHSVQKRINSEVGMSFTEFTYQIFQAYDWLYLFKNHNCCFQIGGSDQMGNILSGHDLISKVEDKPVFAITLPLITTEEGNKFGKSAGNAVWLDETKTSPFSLYQFFIRTKDTEVEKLLRYFTFLSLGEIKHIMELQETNPEKRIAQQKLAEQLTILVHGENGLKNAQRASEALYSKDIKSLLKLTATEITQVFEGASNVSILLEPGLTVLNLAMKAGCFSTENDAIRIIRAGGFHINHQRITNFSEVLSESVHILPNMLSLLRVGKRNYYIVKWT